MNYVVYILYSGSFDKTYVGYTSDLIDRFKSHNSLATKGYTVRYRPWQVIHTEYFSNKSEAIQREKFYKSGIGREKVKDFKEKYLRK